MIPILYIFMKARVCDKYKGATISSPQTNTSTSITYTPLQSKLYGMDGSISGRLSILVKLSTPVKTNWSKSKSSVPNEIAKGFPTGLECGLPN